MAKRRKNRRKNLVSANKQAPDFIQQSLAGKDLRYNANGKRLIVVQLSGGNDGLNTVVPYGMDDYFRLRPNIAIKEKEVLKLNELQGFHPMMESIYPMFESGEMAVINSVGYPNPTRSHFRSMDIWQSASASNEYLNTGWLGRYLDATCVDNAFHHAIEADDLLSLAMKGSHKGGLAVQSPEKIFALSNKPFFKRVQKRGLRHAHEDHDHLNYMYKTIVESKDTIDNVFESAKKYRSTGDYPQNSFGERLKMIAELIIGGLPTTVFYASLGGFDTHVNQAKSHQQLLKIYSEGIRALTDDLKRNGFFDDTLIMTFSEFGRRVKQNASKGTDHGAANNLFLINSNLAKPGFYNDAPNLQTLTKGDLTWEIDFRRVYASVLQWLGADSTQILGQDFEALGVLQNRISV